MYAYYYFPAAVTSLFDLCMKILIDNVDCESICQLILQNLVLRIVKPRSVFFCMEIVCGFSFIYSNMLRVNWNPLKKVQSRAASKIVE